MSTTRAMSLALRLSAVSIPVQIDEEQQRRAALEEFDDSLETYFASADQRDSGKDPLDEFLVDILPGADADKSDEYLEQLLGAEALMEDGDDTVLLPGMDDASADPLDYASDKLA